MKFFLSLLVMLFLSIFSSAQYKGGQGHGFAASSSSDQHALPNIYQGGSNDGYHFAQALSQNMLPGIYQGAAGDGYAVAIAPAQHALENVYQGGVSDGFGFVTITNQNSISQIYGGGDGDGFAAIVVVNQNSQENIYLGGAGDGFGETVVQKQNPFANIYTGGANDGFATIIVQGQNPLGGALPVKLIEFSGRWQQQDILLWWRTANEQNSSHFVLERSTNDGSNFIAIATIPAAGNSSSEMRYQFIDRYTQQGHTYYYRLKSVDADGRFTYSAIIRFTKQNKDITYTIYPNPGSGLFTISIGGIPAPVGYHYHVLDSRGLIVNRGNIASVHTQFDITRLAAGTYFVQIILKDKVQNTFKIILQH